MIEKNEKLEKPLSVSDSSGKSEFKIEISYLNKTKDIHCTKGAKCSCTQLLLFINILVLLLTAVTTLVFWCQNSSKNVAHLPEENESEPTDFNHSSQSTVAYTTLYDSILVQRRSWLAQPPTDDLGQLSTPVSHIIIHHTATLPCSTTAECILQTREIQAFHIESRKWSDIAYNFLIGGDGRIYEGRGWTNEGAHTFGYNRLSLGVAFIGTFNSQVPPDKQIEAFNILMEKGINLGYITTDYTILTGRQISGTESPGKAFFNIIKSWIHWSSEVPTINKKMTRPRI